MDASLRDRSTSARRFSAFASGRTSRMVGTQILTLVRGEKRDESCDTAALERIVQEEAERKET